MTPWTLDSSMACLNNFPLPRDFTWPHRDDPSGPDRVVQPSHSAVVGFGKWLRETPYFPGLFELAHDLLAEAPDEFDPAWLPAELISLRRRFADTPAHPREHLAHKLRRLRLSAAQPSLF